MASMTAVERFVAAIETISDGFALLDENRRFLLINRKFREFYRLAGDTLRVGAPFANFVRTMATVEGSADPEAAVAERMARLATPGEPFELELADGRWIRVADYHAADGSVICLRTDITAQVRREQRLAEHEARTRAIVETALDAIVTIDVSGAIVEFNPTAERVFGYAREEALGRQVAETIVAPAHQAAHLAGFARFLETGEQVLLGRRIEIEAMRADASVFPIELAMTELTLGERRLFTAFIRDLTEAKRLEREMAEQRARLQQSEKLGALGSLLAGVAHELNNPLSVVVAQAAMLEELAGGDAGVRNRAQRIHNAAERCARIIRSFLAMARKRPPQLGAVALERLVDDAVELVGYGLSSAGIALEREIAPDLPAIWGDADQLNQVLTNLLINAQQALQQVPAPRRLALKAYADPAADGIVLEVADSGPGVPDELRERIFEPFFTTKPVGLGTGVGLSVAHGIVAAHGGSIAVDAGAEGGARFTVRLPLGSPAAAEPAKPAPAAVRPRRLLVVDDEPEIVDTIAEILEAAGHTVDTARSGAQALERIGQAEYDMVFSDLRMPDLDGPALFERLKREHPALARHMVIVTGDMLSADARAFLDTSGLVCLEKPFTIDEVRRLAARTLAEG